MTPDQAKFLAGVVGQGLQGEWMHTYKAINAIQEAKKDYKPAPDSRSAWGLAHHIAICDVGFLQAVLNNTFANSRPRPTPPRSPIWPPGTSTKCRRRSKPCSRSTVITSRRSLRPEA